MNLLRALITACLIWVSMSPTAMSAFGQICGAEITAGIMDLQDDQAMLYAIGIKDGQSWGITCQWKSGRPAWIVFANPRPEL
jgi:hypothetical protein